MSSLPSPLLDEAKLLSPALLAEAKRAEVRARHAVDAETIGRFRASFNGTGLTFSELREYQPGDDVRRIHWKASARTNKTYCKSYEEERTLTVVTLIDCSASVACSSANLPFRREAEFAAFLSLVARNAGDSFGLALFSDALFHFEPPSRRRSQLHRVTRALVSLREFKPSSNLRGALSELRAKLRQRSLIFVLSDFHTKDWEEELRLCTLKHDVCCVAVSSTTAFLPDVGIIEVQDSESGERYEIDSSSAEFKQWAKARELTRDEQLRNTIRRLGSDFATLSETPAQALRDLMRQRESRRK